jgi:hypothetical protein
MDVGEHGLERFQVAVNVADNCPFQDAARFVGQGTGSREQGVLSNSLLLAPRSPLPRPDARNPLV